MMKTIILCSLFLIISSTSFSQDSTSVSYRDSNYRKIDIHHANYGLLAQVGVQKRMFATVGISKNYFLGSQHGIVSYDIYIGYSIMPALRPSHEITHGVKLGGTVSNFLVLGGDLFFAKQGDSAQTVFTVKGGFGVGGFHITYGRNLLGKRAAIAGLGKNVFTLTASLNVIKKDLKKGKKSS